MNMFGRFDLDSGGGGFVNPYPTLRLLDILDWLRVRSLKRGRYGSGAP